MLHRILVLSIFFCVFVTVNVSFAQKTSNHRFERIDKSSGLSNNNIAALCKDHLGFMWVGTSDGLCRIETDERIKVFKKSENNSLESNNIRALHADRNGNLWIGTRLGGLTRFNQKADSWKTFMHDEEDESSISNNEILAILEDHEGRIWIGTENGLNLFIQEENRFLRFYPDPTNPETIQSKAILCLTEDKEKRIWIGTWGGGMSLMLPSKSGNWADIKFRNFVPNSDEPRSKNVWQVYQDNQDRYWVGTYGGGLFLMQIPPDISTSQENQSWEPNFHNYKHSKKNESSISQNVAMDMKQDDSGKLWITTGNGLNYVNFEDLPDAQFSSKITEEKPKIKFNADFVKPHNINSIPANYVIKLELDDQGIVWIGTQYGISRYQPNASKFDHFPIKTVPQNNTNSQNIYVDSNNNAWMGLFEKGLVKYNLETRQIDPLNSLKVNSKKIETFIVFLAKMINSCISRREKVLK